MEIIINMYITMLPVILGGISNMIFTKTNIYKKHCYPIDCYKTLKDNKRIFGDNKTIIGFFSMIFFCTLFQIICGFLYNFLNIICNNDLYINNQNTLLFNSIIGFLFGFTYVICELPNSFIKRRLNIECGKTNKGIIGTLFFLIDQIDSLLGVMFILFLFSNISFLKYIGYVLLGGLTHIFVNLILYIVKVRKNI